MNLGVYDATSSLKRPRADGGGEDPYKRAHLDAYGGMDALAPKIYAVTLLVPNNTIGYLIGKGGSVRQQISQESGAKVRVQDYSDLSDGSRERGITLSGPWESIERAQHLIIEKLKTRRITMMHDVDQPPLQYATAEGVQTLQEEGGEPRIMTRWIVPNDKCGLLIGKKGAGINQINMDSGAKIKVGHEEETPPGSNERLVHVVGTKAATDRAVEIIREKVGGRPMDAAYADNMEVPLGAIGHLLGPGGSHIRMVRETSGAKVQVTNLAETEIGSVASTIHFDGAPEQIAVAKDMLRTKLAEWEGECRMRGEDPTVRDITTTKISVPFPLVGHLIGKGGANIKELLKTGALVKILQDEKSHTRTFDERPVLITGPTPVVLDVQRSVCDKMMNAPARLLEQIRPLPQTVPGMGMGQTPSYSHHTNLAGAYPTVATTATAGAGATQPTSFEQVQQAQALLSAYGFNLDLTALAQQQGQAPTAALPNYPTPTYGTTTANAYQQQQQQQAGASGGAAYYTPGSQASASKQQGNYYR